MLRGNHPRAIATAGEAIEVARATGSRISEAHARNTLGTSTALSGRCAEGTAILREAVALTKEVQDVDDMGRAYANLSSVLTICASYEESLEVALEGVAWARSVGASGGYGRFIAGNAAAAAIELGRWDEADAMCDDLLAGDTGGVNRIGTISVVGPFYARRGRAAEAEQLLEEGRALVGPLQEAQFTGPIYVGLVEQALTAGRPEKAVADVADGVARIDRTGDRYYLSELLAMGARAEADRAERARATRDSAAEAEAVATASSYRDILQEWVSVTSGSDAFGGQLAADAAASSAEVHRAAGVADVEAWRQAVALADRTGSAWRTTYARYRLGEAMLAARAPRRDAAAVLSDALARAVELAAEPLAGWIEGLARRSRISITAADEPADDGPSKATRSDTLGLTAREREVLALLVEGHTNRRIGEELFISESTAGVHVSNILGKLGVATRTEAATVAARLGLVE
jgi:DNA-binding NarL/FixJ family response regulator